MNYQYLEAWLLPSFNSVLLDGLRSVIDDPPSRSSETRTHARLRDFSPIRTWFDTPRLNWNLSLTHETPTKTPFTSPVVFSLHRTKPPFLFVFSSLIILIPLQSPIERDVAFLSFVCVVVISRIKWKEARNRWTLNILHQSSSHTFHVLANIRIHVKLHIHNHESPRPNPKRRTCHLQSDV